MPVKLISAAGSISKRDSLGATLFGKPFPSEEIQAYWHMVPDWYVVRWWAGLSIFTVYRMVDPYSLREHGHTIERRVMATEASKLETWMRVITELHREWHQVAAILSPEEIPDDFVNSGKYDPGFDSVE